MKLLPLAIVGARSSRPYAWFSSDSRFPVIHHKFSEGIKMLRIIEVIFVVVIWYAAIRTLYGIYK